MSSTFAARPSSPPRLGSATVGRGKSGTSFVPIEDLGRVIAIRVCLEQRRALCNMLDNFGIGDEYTQHTATEARIILSEVNAELNRLIAPKPSPVEEWLLDTRRRHEQGGDTAAVACTNRLLNHIWG